MEIRAEDSRELDSSSQEVNKFCECDARFKEAENPVINVLKTKRNPVSGTYAPIKEERSCERDSCFKKREKSL